MLCPYQVDRRPDDPGGRHLERRRRRRRPSMPMPTPTMTPMTTVDVFSFSSERKKIGNRANKNSFLLRSLASALRARGKKKQGTCRRRPPLSTDKRGDPSEAVAEKEIAMLLFFFPRLFFSSPSREKERESFGCGVFFPSPSSLALTAEKRKKRKGKICRPRPMR